MKRMVNKDNEEIKSEIVRLNEKITNMSRIINQLKIETDDSQNELINLENKIETVKKETKEISDNNYQNKKKLIGINANFIEIEGLIEFKKEKKEKFMKTEDIVTWFFLVLMGTFGLWGIILTFVMPHLEFKDSYNFFILGIITIILWFCILFMVKWLLTKMNMKIEKNKINLVYSLYSCFILVLGLGMLMQKFDSVGDKRMEESYIVTEVSESNTIKNGTKLSVSKENKILFSDEDFNNVMTIFFALIPSILFKQIILADKNLVYDDTKGE